MRSSSIYQVNSKSLVASQRLQQWSSVKCQLPSLACEYVGVIILKGNMEFYKQDFNVFAFKVYKNQFAK